MSSTYRMTLAEEKKWKKRNTCTLFISESSYFRNADLFLEKNNYISKEVNMCINNRIIRNQRFTSKAKQTRDKKTYYIRRIDSRPLNQQIIKTFEASSLNFKREVQFIEGVFYNSAQIGGFDFALLDDNYNVTNFWNYCFGRRSIYEGDKKWSTEVDKRLDWNHISQNLKLHDTKPGEDAIQNKMKPIIIGEIQMGNWGLLYRDILKAIQIQHAEDIDLLIYITPVGNLRNYISDGTVNYEKSKEVFNTFKNILTVPIWLIGIDIK